MRTQNAWMHAKTNTTKYPVHKEIFECVRFISSANYKLKLEVISNANYKLKLEVVEVQSMVNLLPMKRFLKHRYWGKKRKMSV